MDLTQAAAQQIEQMLSGRPAGTGIRFFLRGYG